MAIARPPKSWFRLQFMAVSIKWRVPFVGVIVVRTILFGL